MKQFLAALLIGGSFVNVTAQWNQCQTLTGGSIITDIIKFNGEMYVAVDKSGLFRSSDDGDSWQKLNVPNQGNFVHLVQHNSELLAVSYGALFRTSDGDVWSNEDGPPAFINAISSDGTTLFAATTSGIYISANAGVDWSLIADVATQISMKSISVLGSLVWASADSPNNGVLFRSNDTGASWTKVLKGADWLTDIYIQGNDVYVNGPFTAIYKSQDNGGTWQSIHANSNSQGLFRGTPTALYHFSNFQLFVSTDSGLNWTVSTHSIPNFSAQTIYPSDNYFFVGLWGGGIYRNDVTGSGAWQAVNSGLTVTEITEMQVAGNKVFVGTSYSFVHSSSDEGLTWDQEFDGYNTPGSVFAMAVGGSDLFVGEGGGGIQRSQDNGSTWELKNTGLNSKLIQCLAATDVSAFTGTFDGLYRTTDRGDNWVKKWDTTAWVSTVLSDGNIVYAGDSRGLFRSENNGDSWTRISAGLPEQSVVHIAQIGSTLFASTQAHGLYKTSNQGVLWEPVINIYASTLAVRNDHLFLGSFNGKVFRSPDLGTTWTDISIGLPDGIITAIDFTDNNIFAGSANGLGLWLRPVTEVLPPFFTFSSNHPGLIFMTGEPIFAKSDEELRTLAGAGIQSSDLVNYITVKDSLGQTVTYTASIGTDKKTITITLDNPTVGQKYTASLSAFHNSSGLSSLPINSDSFSAVDNLPPAVSEISVTGRENENIAFSASMYSNAFIDPESDPLIRIIAKSLPQHGSLFIKTTPLTMNAEIEVASLDQLIYVPELDFSGTDQWSWNGFDGKSYAIQDAAVNITVTPVTEVQKATQDGIQVYPNPASGIVHIQFNNPDHSTCTAVIYDLCGKEVKNAHFAEGPVGSTDVDMTDLSVGIYVLSIEYCGKMNQLRVMKR